MLNILKASLYITLVFITLEACARLDDYYVWDAPFFEVYSSNLLRYEDEYGKRNRPNYKFEKWKINSHGFRGNDIDFVKPDGVKRVVILGASESFGLYESAGQEYPAQLQSLSQNLNGDLEVINASSAGLSIPQMTKLFESFLIKYSPDIIVIYPTPTFYLDNERPKSRRYSTYPQMERKHFSLRLQRKIKQKLKTIMPAYLQTLLRKFIIQKELYKLDKTTIWNKPPEDRLMYFNEDISVLIESIKVSGGVPVLMTHAHRFPHFSDLSKSDKYILTSWRRFFPRATEHCLLDFESAINREIMKISKSEKVSVIKLASQLTGKSDLFRDFSHFNDVGSEKVSRIIYNHISQPGWIAIE